MVYKHKYIVYKHKYVVYEHKYVVYKHKYVAYKHKGICNISMYLVNICKGNRYIHILRGGI